MNLTGGKGRENKLWMTIAVVVYLSFYILLRECVHVTMVTSYQANFAIHHIRHRHVGFPSAWDGIGKNKMFHCVLFSSYHTTKITTKCQECQHTQSIKVWNPMHPPHTPPSSLRLPYVMSNSCLKTIRASVMLNAKYLHTHTPTHPPHTNIHTCTDCTPTHIHIGLHTCIHNSPFCPWLDFTCVNWPRI